jgi:predicted ATPase/DNA-binding SARP family transcriptional activator
LSSLNIYLLGSPRVERQDAPIEVDTRKAIALLAYLAGANPSGSQRRDSLATFFWPEVDSSRAHGALRRTLSALHKALGGEGLKIDRDTVSLERGVGTWIDVDVFHGLLAECRTHGHPANEVCPTCLPRLSQAASLYRDDFMAGFSLRDSPAFDDWQFFQVESLRRELAGALERLAHGLSAQGDFEAAIAHARRWSALDPLHEPAHRQLMLLFDWAGQRTAALRQYREAVRVLQRELSVAPLAETTALYEAIKENRVPAPPLVAAAATQSRDAQTNPALTPIDAEAAARLPAPATPGAAPGRPLVGRGGEWSALLSSYAAARDGRLVVIEGEAGIGKTRLAESFLEHARERGARTALARCYEGELNLAYGPFVEGLRGILGHSPEPPPWLARVAPQTLSEVGRLLPELLTLRPDLPPTAPLDSPGAQGRFFDSLRQVLLVALGAADARNGNHVPGVLLIDDSQWIDEASLDLLTYLVRRLGGQSLLLLVTWRGEQVPAGHRLRQLLAEAGRTGRASSMILGRLSLAAVTELATQAWANDPATGAGRAPLEPVTIERLYHESEGLPFFVVEYLAALSQAGDGPASWSLPGGVRSLLQTRLARVDEASWQLLSTAAVIGRWFDFDTLHTASGRSDDETVSGLEALIAFGLVSEVNTTGRSQDQTRYDFNHEKLRSLVYEETSLARRRLLHRRVAEALSARAKRQSGAQAGAESSLGAVASQIAQHFQQAGRDSEASEYFRLAGEHARALFANAEALGHFRAALALGHPAGAALHQAIGDLLTLSGAYAAALTSYETAAALSAPGDLPVIEHKLGDIYHRRGDWELAESHFQAALNALGETGQQDARARIFADWSLSAHRQGDTPRALELAGRALELAEAAGDRRALAQAHNILGILASSQNDRAEARHHLERSLELAEALGEPGARAAALNNLALALRGQGDFAEAVRLTEQALALSAAQGDRHREAALHNNLADLLHATGQAEAARQHVRQSVTIYAEIGAEVGLLQPEIWKLSEW